MISRRKFFSITLLMVTVLFLCMCLNNLKDSWNDYAVNKYTETAENYPSKINMYIPGGSEEDSVRQEGAAGATAGETVIARRKVVCVGDEEELCMKAAEEWAAYTKRDIAKRPSLAALGDEGTAAEMLVIDPACVDWESDREIGLLTECVEAGTHLVFCGLPDVSVIKGDAQVRELLGIRKVLEEETNVSGFYLGEGFLLGGRPSIWKRKALTRIRFCRAARPFRGEDIPLVSASFGDQGLYEGDSRGRRRENGELSDCHVAEKLRDGLCLCREREFYGRDGGNGHPVRHVRGDVFL